MFNKKYFCKNISYIIKSILIALIHRIQQQAIEIALQLLFENFRVKKPYLKTFDADADAGLIVNVRGSRSPQ